MKKSKLLNQDYQLAKTFHINSKLFSQTSKKIACRKFNEYNELKIVASKKNFKLKKEEAGNNTLYNSLENRSSYRNLEIRVPIDLSTLSNLLIYAYSSVPGNSKFIRAIPSAGGRYPVSLYLISFNVINLQNGIYYWDPFNSTLCLIRDGNFRNNLKNAINNYNQKDVEYCSFAIIITADIDKTCSKYGDRGYRFVCMDVGSVSQNFYLLSNHLKIGTRAIGGFFDDEIKNIIFEEKGEVMLVHIFGKESIPFYEQLEMNFSDYFHSELHNF